MRRLSRFLGLAPVERRLLVRAAVLLLAIRVGLVTLPFQLLRPVLASGTRPCDGPRSSGPSSPDRIGWAVSVASRYVPVTCLSRALAARLLLARQGLAASLRIGVARGEDGRLEAHAWVESGETVVVGASAEFSRFSPLPVPPLHQRSPQVESLT